jgi:hypothetical protein
MNKTPRAQARWFDDLSGESTKRLAQTEGKVTGPETPNAMCFTASSQSCRLVHELATEHFKTRASSDLLPVACVDTLHCRELKVTSECRTSVR